MDACRPPSFLAAAARRSAHPYHQLIDQPDAPPRAGRHHHSPLTSSGTIALARPTDGGPPGGMDMHEHTAGRATLAVLGAGPKGLAIAAKRAALARTGWDVPGAYARPARGVLVPAADAAATPGRAG